MSQTVPRQFFLEHLPNGKTAIVSPTLHARIYVEADSKLEEERMTRLLFSTPVLLKAALDYYELIRILDDRSVATSFETLRIAAMRTVIESATGLDISEARRQILSSASSGPAR